MVELLGTFMALVGIAVFCIAGAAHERWENSLRVPYRREHRCRKCGYNLRGVEAEVCPECGLSRTGLEPLPTSRRTVVAAWMGPAVVACMFGLAATRADMIGASLLGTVLTTFAAVACRTIPMTAYFVTLAVGLTFFALAGLAGREDSRVGVEVLTTIAAVMLFVMPLLSAVLYLWRGRMYLDTPST